MENLTKIFCSFDLKGKTMISGFHGVGLVGIIAMRHIIKELDAERVGFITHPEMPLYVTIKENSLLLPIEIYSYKDLLFLQVNPTLEPEVVNEVAEALISFLKQKELKEILLIGGLDEGFKEESKDKMKGVSNSHTDLSEIDIPFMDSDLSVFGPLASFLTYGEIEGMPVKVILPYAARHIPDPEAASVAIEKLENLYGFKVDKKKLSEDANKIEKEISRIEEELGSEEHQRMFR